jgi:hypothetical protein
LIWVAEFTTNVAIILLNVTPIVLKFAPLTVPLMKFVPVIGPMSRLVRRRA